MGRLSSLLHGVETSIRSRLGSWMQEVSLAGDEIPGMQADITQLQVDITAPGWLSAFITQSAWYVNATAGNDANDASVGAPIKTLAELTRRFEGRTVSPALATLTVNLTGAFTETLVLNFANPGPTTQIIITAPMTTVYSGTIGTYVTAVPTTNTRYTLADAGLTVATHVRRRVRLTSGGGNAGALTWICSAAAANIANIGQFFSSTGTAVNPANGTTYDVETFGTTIWGYDIRISGGGNNRTFRMENVTIKGDAANITATSRLDVNGRAAVAVLFGCLFDCSSKIQTLSGFVTFTSCAHLGNTLNAQSIDAGEQGFCHFHSWQILANANVAGNSCTHDGNAANAAGLAVTNCGYLEDIGNRGFFGSIGGAALASIDDNATWFLSAAGSLFWGAAGNTSTNALAVKNGSGVSYVTKPTATALTPGSDVVLAGAGAIAWAGVPALAASPDNAFVNVRH